MARNRLRRYKLIIPLAGGLRRLHRHDKKHPSLFVDPLLQDYWESNLYAIMNTKGARTVILEGECHLMELDAPDRMAAEVFAFIDESRKNY